MKKTRKIILRIALVLLGLLAAGVAALLIFLSVTEYKPEDDEPLAVDGTASRELALGDSFRVMTWNIGYGALGDNADFFMDGGTKVMTADENRVNENLAVITDEITRQDPDIVLLQETDVSSDRSWRIDETARIAEALGGGYRHTFASNFKVAYVPYPIPPIGKVDSGLFSLSRYPVTEAHRQQLPIPFAWPVRMANLKRCLAIHRIPIKGSDHELVIFNLHLEAYDGGAGKLAQTLVLKSLLETEVENGNYVIAAGDFNQSFSSVSTLMYPLQEGKWKCGVIDVSEYDDSLLFLMDNTVPTCRSLDQSYADYEGDKDDFQYYMIDGFIVSCNLDVTSLETLDLGFRASDHNPVVAEITLR